jgi:hypothetical protein
MADAQSQPRVQSSGTVTVRQRPSLLLMTIPLHAAEATLELGLTSLKKQCEAASRWLTRLDAIRVEFGEPHFADQAGKDPLNPMRAAAARTLGQPAAKDPSSERKRDVNVILTAIWDISAMSAEEILVFVDRLQFEAATDADAAEPAEETQQWQTPEEQFRGFMAQMAQPPTEDRAPQFLFIARLSEEQWTKASAAAFTLARQNAERLARTAGMHLGKLGHIHYGTVGPPMGRTDKIMSQQRCGAILARSSYEVRENEIISDYPQSAEFTVTMHVQYQME